MQAAHGVLLADVRNAVEIAAAKPAQLGKLSDPEHFDACYVKALADNFIQHDADRTDEAVAASVLETYSAVVVQDQDELVQNQAIRHLCISWPRTIQAFQKSRAISVLQKSQDYPWGLHIQTDTPNDFTIHPPQMPYRP